MTQETTRKWVEQQPWHKGGGTRHYGERCKKAKCKCIRKNEKEET